MKENNLKKRHIRDKMKRFCEEYVVDLNATQAAIRAGYSAKTAGCKVGELMKDEEINRGNLLQ